MKKTIRFVIIPKVAHPWFEEVNQGARTQAEILSRELGVSIVVDYMPPAFADTEEQKSILEKARVSRPDGIALDPVDALDNMGVINSIKNDGIPLVLFDSPSPDKSITCIGTNFARQGIIAVERFLELINCTGKVAVMQGYPTAPNHKERYEAELSILKKNPNITIVDGGIDNDDIETAFQQATAVISSNPDLSGYLCCDASGPIGIAKAVKAAGKTGEIKIVAMDGIRPILNYIKEGVIEFSSASIPKMQGSMSILMLWQASLGVQIPPFIDTGVVLITQENIDRYLADAGG
ncbi:MAG: substrate-binding domain-containing protein [Bacteroidota bacterium]|nr:substrate-binding domain-containing protein [Bacteroidota bacterium]